MHCDIKKWTTAERADLKRMIEIERLGHTAVGRALGRAKSAISGQVRRMRLAGEMVGEVTTRDASKRPVTLTKPKMARVPLAPANKLPPRKEPRGVIPGTGEDEFVATLHRLREQETDVPFAQLRQLIDLEPHHCRYPVGDPRSEFFGFCPGNKIPGLPYCEPHAVACLGQVAVSKAKLRTAPLIVRKTRVDA